MSAISQFFPSGGGGGGSETPTGAKVTPLGVPVEILGVSGSGSGGGPGGNGGFGGTGAVFHANNYFVQPGCTVPITIGAGGVTNACPCGQGGQGGTTSFNYPFLPISVVGGGGGAKNAPCSCNPYGGCPGGTGGGGRYNSNCPGTQQVCAGEGRYFSSIQCVAPESFYKNCPTCNTNGNIVWLDTTTISNSEPLKYPWGIKAGFPGMPACKSNNPGTGGCYCKPGFNGRAGGSGVEFTTLNPTTWYCPNCPVASYQKDIQCCGEGYRSDISGTMTTYGTCPGTFGYQDSSVAGCPGGLIVQWACGFGAAPPTGFPGATDISPDTPGYYTYCFTSSGSITLP